MFTVADLQRFLGVENNRVILYGYTFDRDTVVVFFEDEKLVREDYNGYKDRYLCREWESNKQVPGSIWTEQIKRWYRNGTNARLRSLILAFGGNLCETDGGSMNAGDEVYKGAKHD